jgi:two-component system cell cycle sensor histidine kinase/response regulator CckA
MPVLRKVTLHAAIVLAASATGSVAAPAAPPSAATPAPWLIYVLMVLVFLCFGGIWMLVQTSRRLQRAKAGSALPPQETLNAMIIRESSDAIFTLNAAGLIQSLNPAAARQFGYSVEEIRDKSIAVLIPPPARGRQRANYMASGASRELFGVRRDGSRFPIDVKLDELVLTNAKLTAVSVRDISTRYAAEKELEHQLASAEATLNQLGTPLFILSPEGLIRRMNRASETLFDFSAGEVRGQAIWAIVAMPPHAEQLRRQFEEHLCGPFPARAEMVFARRDGHEFTVNCVFTATLDETGAVESIVLTANDTSARKAFESSHLRTERLAAVSRLAGGVAHDFNNLLTAITGYSGLALQNLERESPIRRDLEEIKRAGDRGAAITRQLLALSGHQPRRPQRLHLGDSVKGAEQMLRVLAGESVQVDLITASQLPMIEADPAQVEEALLHLAAFLRERMPKGSRLVVTTEAERVDRVIADSEPPLPAGDYAVLTLSDTAPTLSREAIVHLFEPFFPVKETTRTNGLGLAMVAGLIKQNGGAILVSAKAGGGNKFRIYWPKAATAVQAPDRPAALFVVPKPAAVLEGNETILLAMGDAEERARIRGMLTPAGYTVIEGRSGLQALEIAHRQQETLHAVITDIILPGMSGPDVIQAIRMTLPAVRSLYVTSQPPAEIMKQGLTPASVITLQPDADPKDLLGRLRTVLSNKTLSVGQ